MNDQIAVVNCLSSVFGLGLGVWMLVLWTNKKLFAPFFPLDVSKAIALAKMIFASRVFAMKQLDTNKEMLDSILKPEVLLKKSLGQWTMSVQMESSRKQELKVRGLEATIRKNTTKKQGANKTQIIDLMVEHLEQAFRENSSAEVNESLASIWTSPPKRTPLVHLGANNT